MTENNGLSDGDDTVDIRNCLILELLIWALDVVLLDVIENLFLLLQANRDGRWNDVLCKFHDFLVIGRAEQHHLTFLSKMLVKTDALILMSLLSNHHVSFIKHKDSDVG